mmetsp:Transcript_11199/g.17320  ORF Transcript_11199/g.17320 Transcript_11199/m.17320 type:complete len:556 (-) Transcript_11199:76-1743(-)
MSGAFSLIIGPLLTGILCFKYSFSLILPLTPTTQRLVPYRTLQLFDRNPQQKFVLFTASSNEDHELDEEESLYQEWRRKRNEFEEKVRLEMSAESEKDPDDKSMFDLKTEMKKVVYIDPGLPFDSPEQQADEKFSQLEGEMYEAIEKFDMRKAEKIRNEISQSHIDDCGAVLQVNSAFYDAFEKKNYSIMEKLWLHDATSLCIHPSHKPLVGADAVLESWKLMFQSSAGDFQQSWMVPSNIRLVVRGVTAVITCDEDVYSRRFVRGKKRETDLTNKLTATNIFRKVNGQWYIVYHHASWHEDSNAAKMALNGSSSGGNSNTAKGKSSKKPDAFSGIMGTNDLGPFLGGTGQEQNQGQGGSLKKIILGKGGSLSDIFDLGGSLGDILSGGEGNDNGINIVRLGSSDQTNSDDDEEEDQGEIIRDLDTFNALLQESSNGKHTKDNTIVGKSKASKSDEKIDVPKESGKATGPQPKDSLRQSCILALRKLCDKGNISQKQKRVLLTDIITCSARGEYSMVEVAYELLCGCEAEDGQDDIAEEEFADQCRVFSQSLSQT